MIVVGVTLIIKTAFIHLTATVIAALITIRMITVLITITLIADLNIVVIYLKAILSVPVQNNL
jgi:hypothetical protein